MVKRFFDLLFSLVALVLTFPLLLFIALLVKLFLGSPVIFKQNRPGLHGKIFTLYKFRTMLMPGKMENKGSDCARITKFGKILRSTSIDELPELINVIKGDMSLVGPRPLLVEYLELYSPEQFKRHNVLPGITGWAQINGRNNLTWKEKFSLDIWYVNNRSFWLDCKILFITFKKVLAREGINAEGESTVAYFKGE
jgi:sugar transferase EpsL